MDWKPIETAPRDGTRVLTWQPNPRGSAEVIQRWIQDVTTEETLGAWADDEGSHCAWDPTFWMPLPSAPGAIMATALATDQEPA